MNPNLIVVLLCSNPFHAIIFVTIALLITSTPFKSTAVCRKFYPSFFVVCSIRLT